jgi:hypothetical protein
VFSLKAHLITNPQERQVRQLILESAKLEAIWANFAQDYLTGQFDFEPRRVFVAEHDFLESADPLYRAVLKNNLFFPKRLFPSELLHPIHVINKPQKTEEEKTFILSHPHVDNLDLARIGAYGFGRLSPTTMNSLNDQDKKKYFVRHADFIRATDDSNSLLKDRVRQLREALIECSTDWKCACSFVQCCKKLQAPLNEFKTAWDLYQNSHELLQEISRPLGKKNYFSNYYQVLREKSLIPLNEYIYKNADLYGTANYLEEHAQDSAAKELKEDLKTLYPHSLTAQMYSQLTAQ